MRATAAAPSNVFDMLLRFEIPALKVHRHGSKRTVIENFTDVASVLNRENEHVRLYLSVELGTECHLAPVSRLIIDGKFVCRQLEAVIKKYATEFVESPSLKGSFDTVLTRRAALLLFLVNIVAACSHFVTICRQGPSFQAHRSCVQQDGQQVQITPCVCKSERLCVSPVTRRFVPSLRHTAHTTTKADRKKERHAT